MEKLIRVMMELIASEVCGKAIEREKFSLSDDELLRLYKLSKAHDLAHLVGDALIKNDLIKNDEIKSKLQKQILLAVYRYEKINFELGRLRETLSEANIPFVPLKGAVIRLFYPEPWMRTSCDIDILVREDQVDDVAQLLVDRLKYTYEKKNYHDISLMSESGVHLELHHNIKEQTENIDCLLEKCWDYTVPVDGFEYRFTNEFFLFHQVAHASYHFIHGGCGIRPILDMYLLKTSIQIDKKLFDTMLEKTGTRKFYESVLVLANTWFGEREHTAITHSMQEYLLSGGVYGTTENRVSVQQVRTGGKARYALSRIWLPYESLKFYYHSLDGKRFLLPFYEVRRWCRLIFCGGMKRSVNELKINSSTTSEARTKAKEMLSMLELD